MEVRSGRQSGLAEIADDLTLVTCTPCGNAAREPGHVIVGGHVTVGVLDLDATAIAERPIRP